jgi:LacI family transcriptional regulator
VAEGPGNGGRRPTMRDVARVAGVSPSAVSFVLNDRRDARIGQEARERILAAVEQLGFRPDLTARHLRMQRTHTIGLVTDEIASSPFAGQIVRAAQDVAWSTGRLVFVVNTGGDVEVEATAVRERLDRRVDGLIYAANFLREVTVVPDMKAVPTVLVNCFPAETAIQLPAVVPAERHGGGLAVQRLIDAGHREIVYLAGEEHMTATRERTAAFRERMRAANLRVGRGSVVHGEYTIDSGYERAMAVLGGKRRPTALLCGNDRIALGALLAAREHGLDVPGELSLVGYDDQEHLADRVRPALTTVSLPHYRMGELGVQTLLDLMEGAEVPARQQVEGDLIERGSVGAPVSPR